MRGTNMDVGKDMVNKADDTQYVYPPLLKYQMAYKDIIKNCLLD
jgi:hypothetical protein